MEKEKAEIASLVERYGRVQSLMKYVNSDTLKESYNKQPKGKVVGVDGITKEQYGENLEENIESLLVRMKKFSYKPYPVRRAYIPKGNGKMRGLGIPSFEDKVVQGVFKEILEAIYEPKFKEFSFWVSSKQKLSRCHSKSKQTHHGRQGQLHFRCRHQAVKKWIWEHMHESIADTIEALNVKLTGHYRYYGIYGNYIGLQKYYKYVRQELWKSKRRRDQTYWLTW